MRVCFDGLCFASKRPAVDEETQTVLCGGATALDVRPINHSTGAPNDTVVVSYASSIPRNNHIHTVPPTYASDTQKLKLRMQEPNTTTVPSTDYGNNNAVATSSPPSADQPPYYINNCYLATESSIIKNPPPLTDHIEALYINEAENNMNLAPRERELLQAVVEREARVRELEECLRRKDEVIAELKSQLDKFQSVFPFSRTRKTGSTQNNSGGAVQRQRAQGISAEPQSESSVLELLKVTFPKYDKEER
ncbi:cGMP-dependent protein kinase, isozyme 2 forms cD4/T1/T3A/T3B-like [Sergentomyia squamirostris]